MNFTEFKRIVIKLGSNVLTVKRGLNADVVSSVAGQIARLIDNLGLEIIVVSSGAMAAGLKKLDLKKRPDETPERQAISAVGQCRLVYEYERAFAKYGKKVAQLLLTEDGLSDRKRYLNARNTIHTLLGWKVIPIINENDTVAVESIQFGDNDNLAAMIGLLTDADMVINLTDIDGLFDRDPRKTPHEAVLLREISTIDEKIEGYADSIPGPLGRGGMLSKITAAKKLTTSGVPMIIANGLKPDVLISILEKGEQPGTLFIPAAARLACRKRWIGFSIKPEGKIVIDRGAAKAILERGKSLLPGGVVEVVGNFHEGAAVELLDVREKILGVGLTNYGSGNILKIKGCETGRIREILGDKPYDEVIHRNNLTVTLCEQGGVEVCCERSE